MAKFGSVEWQNEMAQRAMMKFLKGEKLDSTESAFISVQLDMKLREGLITPSEYKKSVEMLKKVM